MRKLASVREIKEIFPIPNANLLELAIIDGWQTVVKKGEYQPGDKVIYCEIDSFLPIKPEYEFLRKSCYRKLVDGSEGFHIKTVKLRGQLSQGLVLPLFDESLEIGQDVTEILGITKYDSTVGKVGLGADIKGRFPIFIPKTDEERIQNLSHDLSKWVFTEKRLFTVTEKLDGTSFTCYNYNDEFGVCSRNYALVENDSSIYWQIVKQYNLAEKMRGLNLAIQGEIIGPGIQSNKYKLTEPQLFIFNVFNIDAQNYYNQSDAFDITKNLNLNYVPTIEINNRLPHQTHIILNQAEGKSLINPAVEREGLVYVSDYPTRVSFKAISNKYLLKEK